MNSVNSSVQSVFETLNARESSAPDEQRPSGELGQDDFLELMLAQMKNQDPMSPMKGEEFLGQLAQFATVSGVQSMESAISELAQSLQSSRALQASGLVGRSVYVGADHGYLSGSGTVTGRVPLPGNGADLTVDVTDASGALVQRIKPQASPDGYAQFQWSGTTHDGSTAPPGTYGVSVTATSGGQVTSIQPQMLARVESVSLGQSGQGMQLNLAGMQSKALEDVLEVL